MSEVKKSYPKRGFASMDPEKRRVIASMGGKKAHALGVAHTFTSEEAKAAGMKGGMKISENRAHMEKIGRRGGTSRGAMIRARHKESLAAKSGQAYNPAEPVTSEE